MTMNRRQFTQSTAAIAASSALPLAHAADEVKIGYVSPQTGRWRRSVKPIAG